MDMFAAEVAVQSILDVRLLWQSIPDLFSMIHTRRYVQTKCRVFLLRIYPLTQVRNLLAKSPNTWALTVQLFSNLPKLAAHLVKLDARMLAHSSVIEQPDEFELVSPYLLMGLASITHRRSEEPHLNNSHSPEDIIDSSVLLDMFQKESCRETSYGSNDGSMIKLARLSEEISQHLTRHPRKSMEHLARICALAESIAVDTESQMVRAPTSPEGPVLRLQRNSAVAVRMFQTVSTALRQVVDKSANNLNPELVPPIVTHLSSLLRVGLRGNSKDATDMLISYRRKYPTLPEIFAIDAIQNEWRFSQLNQMITSRQMQLRVVSLSHLATQLISEWKKCQEQFRDEGSVEYLHHLSRQLTATGLVDYLLGPTCHPEIIMDGFNIIGFLAVTETYEHQQTDLFWQTMTTTQDPRICEALVRMMAKTVTHFAREPLAYLIQKMQSLRTDAFTAHMRELCEAIFKAIFQKHSDLVSMVAKLCLRLVQESSMNDSKGYPEHMVTFEFASTKLFELLHLNTNPTLRQELVQECLSDISLKSRSTTGSLHVLFRIIRPTMNRDLTILVTEQDFPRLLVEELQASITAARLSGSTHVYASTLGVARRGLIENVIAEHGALIHPKHVEQLWHLLVGEEAASQEDRTTGWQSLNSALKAAHPDNPFLNLCLQHHLPKLPPILYCPGTLQFIRQAISPLANSVFESDTAPDGVYRPDNGPLELLWQIILKAPRNTIETQAINILVSDIYVKGKSITSLSPDRARKVHLTLVDKCLQQMAEAAKALLTESTNLDTDDKMAVSEDGHSFNQELVFTRSLFVLQEFVAALQDKSLQFAAPDLRSLMLQSPSVIEGEPAELKVQSFDGNEQTDVQPLTIGRQNTAASLLASIREATGFNNYRIFYRGAPLTPTEDQICKSLEELKIHNGLILVKKESDAVSTPVNIKPGASPLEIEILVHFQAFWDYLSMDEKIAKEVRASNFQQLLFVAS